MSTAVSSAKKRLLEPVSGSLTTLVERRWLIWHFVQDQLSRSYRNSFLGVLWLVLSPLLMIILYTLVFSEFLGLRFREGADILSPKRALNYGIDENDEEKTHRTSRGAP